VKLTRARSGDEALRLILANSSDDSSIAPPVATLVDIKMPRMSGLELLAELDRRQCEAPVGPLFMLTTSSSPDDRQAASAHSRVRDYLVKPLSACALERLIDEALAH